MTADDLRQATWVSRDEKNGESVHVRACRLEVVRGPDAGRVVTVAAPRLRIGREHGELVLTDQRVSALHCEIELDPRGYRLRDLESKNGTFVGGVRVLDAYLPREATLEIGESSIRFLVEVGSVELPIHQNERLVNLIGRSPAMRRLFADVDRVAATDATVLVTGETGVGKERVAEAIHELSPRSAAPFVVLDCGAVPPQLFESQLFGHEAGAFTDAKKAAPGVFELADGGTVFLDEIGELPLELQTRLLRVVETRTVRRLGSQKARELDVRVVAATNRDLAAEVNRGTFRSDLFYRLSVVELFVPPLRERQEDIELLVQHFVGELDPKGRGKLHDVSEGRGFLDWARAHPWPGNVRQLKNAVERALTLGPSLSVPPPSPTAAPSVDLAVPFREAKQRVVDDFDRRYITALLSKHGGNVSAAARAAGLDRMSIYKAIQRLGLGENVRS